MEQLLSIDDFGTFLESYDAISFDVFDTLLYRHTFAEPHHLFHQLAMDKGLDRDAAQAFVKERRRAEAICREKQQQTAGHSEVHLEAIYAEMAQTAIMPADEIALEKRCLRPRPFIKHIYEQARKQQKRVFAISDFYLNEIELTELLADKAYVFDGVYTSCSRACGKYDKRLFKVYLEDADVAPERALHLGDNAQSDYLNAMASGITAYCHLKPAEQLQVDTRLNPQSVQALETHARHSKGGIQPLLLAYLAQRSEDQDDMSALTAFALQYALPLVTFFAQWLLTQCRKDEVTRLFLMARDGYALEPVIKQLAPALDCQVFHVSRRAVWLPAAVQERSLWDMLFTSLADTPIIDILDDLELDASIDIKALLPEQGRESFTSLSLSARTRFLEASYRLALPQMKQELASYQHYASDLGLFEDTSAVVDVGWNLSSHKALDIIAGHPVRGYYMGSVHQAYDHERIRSFLFSRRDNRSSGWQTLFEKGVELLELPFVSTEDQTLKAGPSGFRFRRDYLPDRLRAVAAIAFRAEIRRFLDFSHDFDRQVADFDQARDCLEALFTSLINRPTQREYRLLTQLPHDRYIAGNRISTVADYWQTDFTPAGGTSGEPEWRQLIHKLLFHIRMYGITFTARKAMRRIIN